MTFPSLPRSELRARRRALDAPTQRLHATLLTKRLANHHSFLTAKRIAFYWPSDGEIDPKPALILADKTGKACYLPVVSPIREQRRRGRLWFARFRPGQRLRLNRFGIPEPLRRGRHLLKPRELDLIILPLVGFDSDCHRIGMGGGFYDRTLAYLGSRTRWRRPRLLGAAHECQRLARIEPRPWDIPLDAVATETRIHCKPPRSTPDQRALI